MTNIDFSKYNNMSSTDIDNAKVELEKELQTLIHDNAVVQEQYNIITRDMIDLDIKKKEKQKEKMEIKIILDKSKSLIQEKKNEISIVISKYWQNKN